MKPRSNAPQYVPRMGYGPAAEKKPVKSTAECLKSADFEIVYEEPDFSQLRKAHHKAVLRVGLKSMLVFDADESSCFDPLIYVSTPAEFFDRVYRIHLEPGVRDRFLDSLWLRQVARALGADLRGISSNVDGVYADAVWEQRLVRLSRRGAGDGPGLEIIIRKYGVRSNDSLSYIPFHFDDNLLKDIVFDSELNAAVVRAINPIRKSPQTSIATPETSTMTKTETTRMQQMTETVKTDATDAMWRTAGSQFVKLARDPLVGVLSRHLGPDDEALRGRIAAFLSTEVGTALLAGVLAAGLSAMPKSAGAVPERLARELRVKAMADMSDQLADVLMGPLRQVMMLYLQDSQIAAAVPSEPRALDAPNAPLSLAETAREAVPA